MKEKIKMAGPWISQKEIKAVSNMMKNGWDSYEYVEKFETEFAKWHSRKFCLMTTCGTHALDLLIKGLGIGKGDEIIIPDCTWTGSSAPVVYNNASIKFIDIDPKNWCLDIDLIEKKISKKTRAIISVNLYGNMPNYQKLNQICKKYKLILIEDAAESLGSCLNGKRAGSFGIGSIHSFHRTKTIATGEGGALLLDNKDLYLRCKFLRDHGRSNKIPYFIEEVTPKYMPSNLIGSLALSQFHRIDELVNKKRKILHLYKKYFSSIQDQVFFNQDNDSIYNGAWATTMTFSKKFKINSLELIKHLKKVNIPLRPFFYPLSTMPAYKKFKTFNPNANDIFSRSITLPSHFYTSEKQIKFISKKIIEVLKIAK